MSGEDVLIDLPWGVFTVEELEEVAEKQNAKVLDVEVLKEIGDPSQPRTFFIRTKVLGLQVGMKMGIGGEVRAKCECNQYVDGPCIHIAATWVKAYKPMVQDYIKLPEKNLEEKVEEATKELEDLLEEKKAVVAKVESVKVEGDKAVVDLKPVERDVDEKLSKKVTEAIKASGKAQKLVAKSEEEAVKLVDELDEKIILGKYQGGEPLIYKIKTKEGTRIVLSAKGYAECLRRYGNVHVLDVKFTEISGQLACMVFVRDLRRNNVVVGVATRIAGASEDFRLPLLYRKAFRNALKNIIPYHIEQQVIEEALKAESWIEVPIREVVEP